jgi:hypothetical protein
LRLRTINIFNENQEITQNRSTHLHPPTTVTPDASKDRESPENRGADDLRQGTGILPGDVARRIFGPDSERAESVEAGRVEIAKIQRQIIAEVTFLPQDEAFHPDAEGLRWRCEQLVA